jgi:hypothetical protein
MGCAEALLNGSVGHSAQQALIGKKKQELFACAGIPVSEKNKKRSDRHHLLQRSITP